MKLFEKMRQKCPPILATILAWLKYFKDLIIDVLSLGGKLLFANPIAWIIYIVFGIATLAYHLCEWEIHDKFVEGRVYNCVLTDHKTEFMLTNSNGVSNVYRIERLYRRPFSEDQLSHMRLSIVTGKRFRISYVENGTYRYATSITPIEENSDGDKKDN